MRTIPILCLVLFPAAAFALDGGGLDASGCFYDLEAGAYHCRRGALVGQSFNNQAEMRQALIVRQAARQGQDKKPENIRQPGIDRKNPGEVKKK